MSYPNLQQQLHQLLQQNKLDEACQLLEGFCKQNSQEPSLWFSLAGIKTRMRDWSAAEYCLQKVLALVPEAKGTHINLGCVYYEQGRYAEAAEHMRLGLTAQPVADGYFNLGKVLRTMGDYKAAVTAYQEAIRLNPQHAEAYVNLGSVHQSCNEAEKAVECYARALSIRPNLPEALGNLSSAYLKHGRVKDVLTMLEGLYANRQSSGFAGSNWLMAISYSVDDPLAYLQAHRRWAAFEGYQNIPERDWSGHDRTPDRRLRVGYVSPDFRKHAVAFFFENLLHNHYAEQVETFCYASLKKEDMVTARLKKQADHWRDIQRNNDAEVCQKIYADGIDILVDLAGHTGGNRLNVFSQCPAPLQVTYLGYPGTTGMPMMNYRMTDIWADPLEEGDSLHTEKVLRLPHSFFCFKPPEEQLEEGELPLVRNGNITLASFNTLAKLTDTTLSVWARVMQGLSGAQLFLMAGGIENEVGRQQLLDRMQAQGMDMQRVQLFGQHSMSDYLRFHQKVDIALDSFPWHGHTTTCHSLWMGVPSVVLAGKRHASRMGVTIMKNMGLDELIAYSEEEYVAKNIALANDTTRLQRYRRRLRKQLLASPLCDGAGLAHDVEAAYRAIWQQWCAS